MCWRSCRDPKKRYREKAFNQKERMATVLVTHPACLGHDTPPGHPERVERRPAVCMQARLPLNFLSLRPNRGACGIAARTLMRAHTRALVEAIFGRSDTPPRLWPRSTPTRDVAGSGEAALRAAGAVIAAVDAVMAGGRRNAFCAVRPPGHHAERDRAMGFCLFNNVAVGALARARGARTSARRRRRFRRASRQRHAGHVLRTMRIFFTPPRIRCRSIPERVSAAEKGVRKYSQLPAAAGRGLARIPSIYQQFRASGAGKIPRRISFSSLPVSMRTAPIPWPISSSRTTTLPG